MLETEYCVIGYGNIGRLVGHALRAQSPLMVSRRLRRGRITYILRSENRDFRVELETAGLEDEYKCKYGFLTVKAYDAVEVASKIKDKVRLLFTLQNGLGVHEDIYAVYGRRRVYPVVVTYGVRGCGENCSVLTGPGEFVFGCGGERICGEIARRFEHGGYKARVAESGREIVWLKALINIGVNAITALTRQPNKALLDYPGLRKTAVLAVLEALSLATSRGIVLQEDPIEALVNVVERTGENYSSMLQDILSCRRTEIEYLNGYVCREGERLGLDVRMNCALAWMVRALEESRLRECRDT